MAAAINGAVEKSAPRMGFARLFHASRIQRSATPSQPT